MTLGVDVGSGVDQDPNYDEMQTRIDRALEIAGVDKALLHEWSPAYLLCHSGPRAEENVLYFETLTIGLELPDGLKTIEFPVDETPEQIAARILA